MSAEPIDVVISFDTTGSMYPCLMQLRRNAENSVRKTATKKTGAKKKARG
jgi:hypothetical protein